jgi:hypothetical protein
MNPNSIASTFSIQKISGHHYLIRGDSGISDYMKFCDTKWSNTYGGWIVHENDEVDLLQMHFEVLDSVKTTRKELSKDKHKKNKRRTEKPVKVSKKDKLYERMKRNEDLSSDEDDDDYIPSTEPSSEDIDSTSDEEDTSDEDEEEETSDEDTSDEDTSDEEDECETDKSRKKEYQFYKKEILAYGYMTERQQEKLDAGWNKILKGWLVSKSYLEKLQKYGWTEVDDDVKPKKEVTQVIKKKTIKDVDSDPVVKPKKVSEKTTTVIHTPMVKKKVIIEEEKTFENYKNMFLVKGKMTLVESASIQAIFHPGMKAYLVFPEFKDKLVELGFKDITPEIQNAQDNKDVENARVLKINFVAGDKLDIKNVE